MHRPVVVKATGYVLYQPPTTPLLAIARQMMKNDNKPAFPTGETFAWFWQAKMNLRQNRAQEMQNRQRQDRGHIATVLE